MNKKIKSMMIVTLLGVWGCGLNAFAATVQNASFEMPALSDGGSSSGVPTAWTGTAAVISVHNPLSTETLQPIQGNNLLWMGDGNNQLTQNTVVVQADTVYTIQVNVGVDGAFTWYRCALRYNGQPNNEFLVDINQNNLWPTTNGWITATLEFNSSESPQLVGKTLQIYLAGENIAFDNVVYRCQPYWDGIFNGGFDYNVVADGQSSSEYEPSGWLSYGTLEILNPASGETLQPTNGQNYLKVTNGYVEYYPEGGIYPQTRYTIRIDVARPTGLQGFYDCKLIYHNGTTWQTLAQKSATLTSTNTWTTIQLECTAGSTNLGQSLRVQLSGQGVAFDNCQITETILRTTPVSTFYISRSIGNDFADGRSEVQPWRTFNNLNAMRLLPGDRILLKRADVWDEELRLWGDGQSGNPIELSAYGTGSNPRINRTDQVSHRCVVIESPSHWRINNLDCRNAKVGVYLRFNQSRNNQDIIIEDCYFEDMDQTANWDPANYNYELSFNTGIMVGGIIWSFNSYQPIVDGLTIRNCGFQRITHSFLCNWYYPPRYRNRVRNLIIENCWQTGGYGVGLFHINGGQISKCGFFMGDPDFMPTGTAQGILQTSKNVVIDQCVFEGASRQGGSADGASFDFEGDTQSCTFSNNVCYNNDGQSLLILGSGGPNKGLTVRDSVFFKNCKDALHWSGHNYELVAWDNLQTGVLQNLMFYSQNAYGLYSNAANFANFTKTNVQQRPLSDVEYRPYYWHFNTNGDIEGWGSQNNLSGLNANSGQLCMTATGVDPYLHSPLTWIVAATNPVWTLKMSSTAGSWAQIYFITHNDTEWNESKSIAVPIISDGQLHSYKIDMCQCVAYSGVITQIRLDPTTVSGSAVCVDYLKAGSPSTRVEQTSYYPESFSVISGTYVEGEVSKLRQKEICFGSCHNPNDYIKINTSLSGTYLATTEFQFVGVPQDSEKLCLECFGREQYAGSGKSVALNLYNITTGQWDVVGTFAAATVDTTKTVWIQAANNYIDPDGTVKLRVALSSNVFNSSYHQYIKIIAVERFELQGDMDLDGSVRFDDFAWMSEKWQAHPSSPVNGFMDGTDINADGTVDIFDLFDFADDWLK